MQALSIDPTAVDWLVNAHHSVKWSLNSHSDIPSVIPTLTTACPPWIGSRGRPLRLREAARLMGFCDARIQWPGGMDNKMWTMMGNTWPVHVVAQIVNAMLAEMGFPDGYPRGWQCSDHAVSLLT